MSIFEISARMCVVGCLHFCVGVCLCVCVCVCVLLRRYSHCIDSPVSCQQRDVLSEDSHWEGVTEANIIHHRQYPKMANYRGQLPGQLGNYPSGQSIHSGRSIDP